MRKNVSGAKILMIVAFVLVSGVAKATVRTMLRTDGKADSVNTALREAASELNEGLPRMLDETTRLDRVAAGNRRMMYYYTLTELPVEVDADVELDAEAVSELKGVLKPVLVDGVCNDMKPVVNAGVSVAYHYAGPTGTPLLSIVIQPSDC
jgi:hypothetical protein